MLRSANHDTEAIPRASRRHEAGGYRIGSGEINFSRGATR
jgi:hypothetical protein